LPGLSVLLPTWYPAQRRLASGCQCPARGGRRPRRRHWDGLGAASLSFW